MGRERKGSVYVCMGVWVCVYVCKDGIKLNGATGGRWADRQMGERSVSVSPPCFVYQGIYTL